MALRKRSRTKSWEDDEYGLELPKFEVVMPEYDDEFEEDTGLLGPDGRPIVRRVVPPAKHPVGFIWIADDDE